MRTFKEPETLELNSRAARNEFTKSLWKKDKQFKMSTLFFVSEVKKIIRTIYLYIDSILVSLVAYDMFETQRRV